MASFFKFFDFVDQLGRAKHDLSAHGLKIFLTNTAILATMTIKGDLTELANGSGYTQPGQAVTVTWTQAAATDTNSTLTVGTDYVWTATADWATIQNVVLYNDSQTSPADALIGAWDYGTPLALKNGETFTVDYGSSLFSIG